MSCAGHGLADQLLLSLSFQPNIVKLMLRIYFILFGLDLCRPAPRLATRLFAARPGMLPLMPIILPLLLLIIGIALVVLSRAAANGPFGFSRTLVSISLTTFGRTLGILARFMSPVQRSPLKLTLLGMKLLQYAIFSSVHRFMPSLLLAIVPRLLRHPPRLSYDLTNLALASV